MGSIGASVPEELWCPLLARGCVHQPEALRSPFFRVSNGGPITSSWLIKSLAVYGWAPSAAPVSSPEVGVGVTVGGAESSNLLIMWLVTSPYHLELPDWHIFQCGGKGLAVNDNHLCPSRNSKGLGVVCYKPRPYTCVLLISQYHH